MSHIFSSWWCLLLEMCLTLFCSTISHFLWLVKSRWIQGLWWFLDKVFCLYFQDLGNVIPWFSWILFIVKEFVWAVWSRMIRNGSVKFPSVRVVEGPNSGVYSLAIVLVFLCSSAWLVLPFSVCCSWGRNDNYFNNFEDKFSVGHCVVQ